MLLSAIIHIHIARRYVRCNADMSRAQSEDMACVKWKYLQWLEPGKDDSQLGAYWNHFASHGFLDCFIDFVCIATGLADPPPPYKIKHVLSLPVSSTALTPPPPGRVFISLWRSRTKGIIWEKIDDKGYYVYCNLHFPNNNVGEREVMRAEQYCPAICTFPPLCPPLLSGYLSIYTIWLMWSLLSFLQALPHWALSLPTLQLLVSHLWSSLSVWWEIHFAPYPYSFHPSISLGNVPVLLFKSIFSLIVGVEMVKKKEKRKKGKTVLPSNAAQIHF